MKKDGKENNSPPKEKKLRKFRLFKKKRGGVTLDEAEIREIKAGRKKLKADMKAMGIKGRKEFELTASSLGLYFDKSSGKPIIVGWFMLRYGGWILSAIALLLLLSLWGLSVITQLKGHFTINVKDELVKEGFLLSESADFSNPTSHLFWTPARDVRDLSIALIPRTVDEIPEVPKLPYFAYTFYMRNEGESTVGYDWELKINSESKNVSSAAWVMVFEDGKMSVYAKAREDGEIEALPSYGSTQYRGYIDPPFYDLAKRADLQYEINVKADPINYWRIKPYRFVDDTTVAVGQQLEVAPGDVHKYTVVIWLEGDDPDCTNALIGGHLGLEMNLSLMEETLE